jgi:hypothetical protein
MRNPARKCLGNFRDTERISSQAYRKSYYPSPACLRVVASGARPVALTAGTGKKIRKKPIGTAQRCKCGHPKSIHARMYANPRLGTPCNFPQCRCKAYKFT